MSRSASSKVCIIWDGWDPLHMAGSARTLTKSFRQRFRCLISPVVSSCPTPMFRPLLSGAHRPPGPSLSNLAQELFRRYKKRIVLKYAADDDHGMRTHDVNHRVSSHFREIVGADHHVVVALPYIVHTRFELNQIVHMRSALSRPFHVANDAAEWKSPA